MIETNSILPHKLIEIPFAEDMQMAILKDKKSCTSRTKRYGNVGKQFWVGDERFELIMVSQCSFRYILHHLWKAEGFDSKEEFAHRWGQIHPRAKWDLDKILWVHHFQRVED